MSKIITLDNLTTYHNKLKTQIWVSGDILGFGNEPTLIDGVPVDLDKYNFVGTANANSGITFFIGTNTYYADILGLGADGNYVWAANIGDDLEAKSFGSTNTAIIVSVEMMPNISIFGDNWFIGWKSLKSISLPAATTFGSYAFQNCTSLTEVSLPALVTVKGLFRGDSSMNYPALTVYAGENTEYMYINDGHLTTLTIAATTPPSGSLNIYDNGFQTLYVPADSVDTYKATSPWSKYASKIQAIPE